MGSPLSLPAVRSTQPANALHALLYKIHTVSRWKRRCNCLDCHEFSHPRASPPQATPQHPPCHWPTSARATPPQHLRGRGHQQRQPSRRLSARARLRHHPWASAGVAEAFHPRPPAGMEFVFQIFRLDGPPKNRPYLSKNLGNIFCEHPVISWY